MEKRYFTWPLSRLSQAGFTFWMGMISTSAVMLSLPQKSSIIRVSARLPMGEPERMRRPMTRLKAETGSGFTGVPTSVILLFFRGLPPAPSGASELQL